MHRPTTAHADADGADLAVVDPHAGVAGQTRRAGKAHVGEGVDHKLLDGAHVGRDGVRAHGHVDDRVPDQLPGAVVGDVPSPVGVHHLGADGGGVDQDMGRVGAHAERVHVRVLEEKEVPSVGTEQTALQGDGVLVADLAQPPDPQH